MSDTVIVRCYNLADGPDACSFDLSRTGTSLALLRATLAECYPDQNIARQRIRYAYQQNDEVTVIKTDRCLSMALRLCPPDTPLLLYVGPMMHDEAIDSHSKSIPSNSPVRGPSLSLLEPTDPIIPFNIIPSSNPARVLPAYSPTKAQKATGQAPIHSPSRSKSLWQQEMISPAVSRNTSRNNSESPPPKALRAGGGVATVKKRPRPREREQDDAMVIDRNHVRRTLAAKIRKSSSPSPDRRRGSSRLAAKQRSTPGTFDLDLNNYDELLSHMIDGDIFRFSPGGYERVIIKARNITLRPFPETPTLFVPSEGTFPEDCTVNDLEVNADRSPPITIQRVVVMEGMSATIKADAFGQFQIARPHNEFEEDGNEVDEIAREALDSRCDITAAMLYVCQKAKVKLVRMIVNAQRPLNVKNPQWSEKIGVVPGIKAIWMDFRSSLEATACLIGATSSGIYGECTSLLGPIKRISLRSSVILAIQNGIFVEYEDGHSIPTLELQDSRVVVDITPLKAIMSKKWFKNRLTQQTFGFGRALSQGVHIRVQDCVLMDTRSVDSSPVTFTE